MATDSQRRSLEQELTEAIENLRMSLQSASEATASIQRIMPRLGQISTVFDELTAVITSGREQLGMSGGQASYSRPTLLVPSAPRETQAPEAASDPWAALSSAWGPATTPADDPAAAEAAAPEEPATPITATLVSFRLEFESKPGPLDLRAVDDAVSEHPSVRDVALLDYDGRKATLKVWIEDTATPASVHTSLVEKAAELFGPENEVTVVAVDEAA